MTIPDPRVIRLLELLANGGTPKELALKLDCSYKSILRLSTRARTVFGSVTTTQAVAMAVAKGIVKVKL
jgi:DNA-binding CsgD family transcriptional regulator